MTAGLRDPDYLRAVAEAAGWRARLTEHDVDGSEAHDQWLAADPLHRRAWQATQDSWDFMGEVGEDPAMIALREAALARAQAGRRRPRPWLAQSVVALAAMLLLAIGLANLPYFSAPATQLYRTGHGERRVIALADGSKVALDAETALEVRLGPDRRDLLLKSGQARFDVAHDTSRPFVVAAGDRAITATGTSFNVDLIGPHVRVTLLEGRVVVRDTVSSAHPAPMVTLRPGDQLDSRSGRQPALVSVSAGNATAWENGRLIFDEEPLVDVAARVSRYTAEPLVVDPAIGDLRISGVFRSGDIHAFIDAVSSYLPVESDTLPGGGIRLRRRGTASAA